MLVSSPGCDLCRMWVYHFISVRQTPRATTSGTFIGPQSKRITIKAEDVHWVRDFSSPTFFRKQLWLQSIAKQSTACRLHLICSALCSHKKKVLNFPFHCIIRQKTALHRLIEAQCLPMIRYCVVQELSVCLEDCSNQELTAKQNYPVKVIKAALSGPGELRAFAVTPENTFPPRLKAQLFSICSRKQSPQTHYIC